MTAVGCGAASQSASKDQGGQTPLLPDVNPANLIYADGWSQYTFSSGNLKIILDSLGHFLININSCGVGDSGVISVTDYNEIATLSNSLSKAPLLPAQKCFTFPYQGGRGLGNGWIVEMKTDTTPEKTIKVFDGIVPGEDMCSVFTDQEAAKKLATALSKVMNLASTQTCNRG